VKSRFIAAIILILLFLWPGVLATRPEAVEGRRDHCSCREAQAMAWYKWLGLFLALLALQAQADITGRPHVIDGDTLEIVGERVRLHVIERA